MLTYPVELGYSRRDGWITAEGPADLIASGPLFSEALETAYGLDRDSAHRVASTVERTARATHQATSRGSNFHYWLEQMPDAILTLLIDITVQAETEPDDALRAQKLGFILLGQLAHELHRR
ncbi:hypothetical protein [Kitasatospora aureofaciens]|uniref:hypothetical protein n=1 Tax=Kitasatospora aureofaciens TaxID=1894 RepID=UPI0037C66096